MLRLHELASSGNCYKVRLLLTQLAIPFERVAVDLAAGEAKSPEFRARSPLGRVPVLDLGGGRALAESNAILCYFAQGTPLFPDDRLERAEVLQWLFWEAERQQPGRDALATLEQHLVPRTFLVGEQYSIADISLYAYTHVAGDAELSLAELPRVCAWLERVRTQPGHVGIDA